jgi:hypothetical protein
LKRKQKKEALDPLLQRNALTRIFAMRSLHLFSTKNPKTKQRKERKTERKKRKKKKTEI